MLIFDSIRIRNFRAIKELTFQPKTDGITGIFGPNGQGKTSILLAVLFALYGDRPKNVPVSSLRRIGSGAAECSVSVVFTHLGQKVEVIRELKGSNDRVVVNIWVNGRPETVTSVGAANKWMQRRFGVDAEGFLTAFIIRQKELDSFVRADPADRKKIIEKLAGVELINKALQSARDNEKDSRRSVDSLPGSEDSVHNAGAEVDFYSEQKDSAETELENIQLKLQSIQLGRSEKERLIELLRSQENELYRKQTQISSAQKELNSFDGQMERLIYAESFTEDDTIESLREQHRVLSEQINQLRSEGAEVSHFLKQFTADKSSLETRVQNLTDQITALSDVDVVQKEIFEKELEKLQKLSEQFKLDVDRLETNSNDLNISIDLLKHSAECPTCHTELADPTALLTMFRNTIEANAAKTVEIETERAANLAQQQILVDNLAAIANKTELQVQLDKTALDLDSVTDKIAALPDISSHMELIETLTKQQDDVTQKGLKLKNVTSDKAALASLKERKVSIAKSLKDLREESELIEMNFSPMRLKTLVQELSDSQHDFEKLSSRNAELSASFREADIRFESSRHNYARLYEQWEKKRLLVEAHARHTLTTDMLDRFRQETVSSIAPELSEYATGLISEMTNGDFIEVRLDEDFKASLVDSDGIERQSSWLSGGEESALALALRLATAFLITGGNSDMLWLDEPLTAQDADRRSAILSLIRTLPIKQIIMINHAQEAKDIVDYEVNLSKEK